MMIVLDDIQEIEDLEFNSKIGKEYLFWAPQHDDAAVFSFASRFENIGYIERHDCLLKNKTKVLVLGDPMEAQHPAIGTIMVIRIMAHGFMWVRPEQLVDIPS